MKLEKFGFCPICSGVSEQVITEILAIVSIKNFVSGECIYRQDDSSVGFYAIKSGQVVLSAQNNDGKDFFVRRAERGESIGESSLSIGHYLESAFAHESVSCVFIPKAAFMGLVARDRELSDSLITAMGKWVIDFHQRLKTYSLGSVRERVLQFFKLEYERSGGESIQLGLKKHEIASNLGMRPETFSRVLTELQSEGSIRISNSRVIIL